MKIKKLVALILVIAALAAMTACADKGKESSPPATSPSASGNSQSPAPDTSSPNGTETDTPPAGIPGKDTLNIGTVSQLGTFQHGSFGGQPVLFSFVFDPIFWYDADTGEMYSDILSGWRWVDDLTFEMTVKDGVYFSNGEQMKGSDILYTLRSYQLKGSPFEPTVAFVDFENSTTSADGLTLTLKCKYTYSPMLFIQPTPVVSEKWCEENGWETQDWYHNPCGSGPFKVAEYVADSHVRFELREDYWGDKTFPYKTVVVKYFGSDSTMYIELESGTIDIAVGVNNEDFTRALSGSNPKIAAEKTTGDYFQVLMWNPSNEYLKNQNIRTALTMATDWETLVETCYGELGIVSDTAAPVISKFYDPSVKRVAYDPDKAKEMLAAEGVKDGDIVLTILTTTQNEKYGTTLQYYLKQVGVTLNLEFMDFATMQMTLFTSTDPTIVNTFGGPAYADPQGTLVNTIKSSTTWPSHTFVDDAEYERIMAAIIATTDEAKQKQYYSELQKRVAETNPFVPFMIRLAGVCYNTDVIAHAKFTNVGDANYTSIVYK